MSWVKIDDKLTSHPKIVAAGNAATGAWVRMLAYAGLHLTDGRIPAAVAKGIASSRELAALVRVGLLRELDGGDYLLHDFLEWNPPSSEVKARREYERDKKQKQRGAVPAGVPRGQAGLSPNPSPRDIGPVPAGVPRGHSTLSPGDSRGTRGRASPVPSREEERSSPPEPLVQDSKSAPAEAPALARVIENLTGNSEFEARRAKALADLERLKQQPDFQTPAAGGNRR